MKTVSLHYLLLICLLSLTACGFHLRGIGSVPFETLYIQDSGAPSISRDLRRSLKANGVKILPTAKGAQGSLDMMSETGEKRILSLASNGRVREYQLIYRVVFRIRDAGEELWGPTQTVEQRRDFAYDDSQTLAKEGEEARLNNDMRSDVVREILRRVSVLSKAKETATDSTGATSAEPAAQ